MAHAEAFTKQAASALLFLKHVERIDIYETTDSSGDGDGDGVEGAPGLRKLFSACIINLDAASRELRCSFHTLDHGEHRALQLDIEVSANVFAPVPAPAPAPAPSEPTDTGRDGSGGGGRGSSNDSSNAVGSCDVSARAVSQPAASFEPFVERWLVNTGRSRVIDTSPSGIAATAQRMHAPTWASAATMLTKGRGGGSSAGSGNLFCFLPLPAETGVPVHLNAPFALTSNRRALWEGAGGEGSSSEKVRSRCIVIMGGSSIYSVVVTMGGSSVVHWVT